MARAKVNTSTCRAPSFINVTGMETMSVGDKVADAVAILGSIDIVLGEIDR